MVFPARKHRRSPSHHSNGIKSCVRDKNWPRPQNIVCGVNQAVATETTIQPSPSQRAAPQRVRRESAVVSNPIGQTGEMKFAIKMRVMRVWSQMPRQSGGSNLYAPRTVLSFTLSRHWTANGPPPPYSIASRPGIEIQDSATAAATHWLLINVNKTAATSKNQEKKMYRSVPEWRRPSHWLIYNRITRIPNDNSKNSARPQ